MVSGLRSVVIAVLLAVIGMTLNGCGGGDSNPYVVFSKPAAPTGVKVDPGDGNATVSWDEVSGAKSYNIYYTTTPGAKATSGKIENATSPYKVTGLTNGLTYYFTVTAVNSLGESGTSQETSVTPVPPPPAPSAITVTPGDGQFVVSWTAVAGATSYNVYYSTTAGVKKTTGVKVANAVAPKTVTGLTNGTTYYVVVTAANSSGESGESGEKSVIPIPALQPPDKPSGVSAAGGNQQVVLGWSEVPNATAYNIYYRTSPGVTKNNGIKVAGVTAPYTVTGLSNGVTYYFVVTAVNSAGEGPESSEKYATPLATPQPPPKPSGIIVSGGDQKVTVQWNAVPTATYYNIYYSTSPGVTKTNGLTIPNVTSPRVVTGLTNGTPYYFVVTAGNAGGEGAESSEKSATPAYIAPPGSPTGVAATAGSGKVTVSWAAVATATSYNIYYSSAYTITADLLAHGTKFSNAVSPQDITGLSAGTKYYFVVTAVNAGGESGGQNTPKNATPTP